MRPPSFERSAFVLILILASGHLFGSEEPRIRFLTRSEGQIAILDDSLEPYFEELQPLEMAAKTGSPLDGSRSLVSQQAECKRRYADSVLDFTPEEEAAVRWYIQQILPPLKKQYPLFANTSWSFIKISASIEGGLPHTRGESIILAPVVLESIVELWHDEPQSMSTPQIGELLIHEQMHVFQRTHPDFFTSLYQDLWGFRFTPPIPLNAWLLQHHLANPDAVRCQWVFPLQETNGTRWIWPLVILKDTTQLPRMPQDFQMIAVPVKETDQGFRLLSSKLDFSSVTNLSSLDAYVRQFPGTTDIYHPNEASADLFAKIVIFDAWNEKQNISAQDRQIWDRDHSPVRMWFQSHFQPAPESVSSAK